MIAPWHVHYAKWLAGSVYAAPPPRRVAFAGALAAAGLGVHVDVMAEAEGLPAGVSIAELQQISDDIGSSRLEVHLIGSPEFADEMLPALLALRPARVFLPWSAFTVERAAAIRSAGVAAWIAIWQEWSGWGRGGTPWPAEPDGALVMLIEPGTSDRCEVQRLDIAASCAQRLPVIVDGGVTEDIAPLCITAGVEAMVVGRALLAEPSGSRGRDMT
ncbi:ribulose phosphate epimerase [Mycolicibacterium sp. XJ870]